MSEKQIIDALGLRELSEDEAKEATPAKTSENTEIAPYEHHEPSQEEIDSQYALEKQRALIEKSHDVLNQLHAVAVQSETARIFEVWAKNLEITSKLHKDLLDLHQSKQSIDPNAEVEPENPKTVNNVLQVSTAEFQRMVKEKLEHEDN